MAVRVLICFYCLVAFFAHAQTEPVSIPLGTGDVVRIDVFNEPELSLREKIGQTGIISMPLIGPVSVLNKRPVELAEELSAAYEDGYLVNADVSVKVESYRPFFVSGSVTRPGAYEFVINLNVEQAIAIAGGLKQRASRKDWYILRGTDKQKIAAIKQTVVLPGDIVVVEDSLF